MDFSTIALIGAAGWLLCLFCALALCRAAAHADAAAEGRELERPSAPATGLTSPPGGTPGRPALQ
jgi:hypothetical protein